MRYLLKSLLRNRSLMRWLRGLYDEARQNGGGAFQPETSIPEITPLSFRASSFTAPRLNLLVPSVALRHLFGGIGTALSLFHALGRDMPDLRLVLTDQAGFAAEDNPAYAGWIMTRLQDEDGPGRRVTPAGDRYGKSLAIGPGDRFIATAWWTALLARDIQKSQASLFNLKAAVKFAYLIQDYEPGFYPWSSRWALAESSYRQSGMTAIFNTSLLRDYFESAGYRFASSCFFEPVLNANLRAARENLLAATPKERRVLVYGRPGTDRNAFQLLVLGLQKWVAMHPGEGWSFFSAGEPHPPIALGGGKNLVPLGKLPIEDYARELARTAIGVSLMISPHPSYPPLEMAAFRARVITNSFPPKDLSRLCPGTRSLLAPDPESLAAALAEEIRAFEAAGAPEEIPAPSPFWRHYLSGESAFDEKLKQGIRAALFETEAQ